MSIKTIAKRSALLGSALGLAFVMQAAAQNSAPMKVGAIFPMTGIGAPTGFSSDIGAKMGINEVNAAGGIMGRKLELVVTDDQFDPTQSVSMAKKLVYEDKVAFILGPNAGQLALAAGPILGEANIAYFTAGSTSLMTPQVAPTGFSMSMAPEEQAVAVIDWAINVKKAKNIAYLGDGGGNSKSMAGRFKPYAEEKGIKIAGMEQFEIGSTDMSPQLLNLRRAGAEVILVQGQTAPDFARILRNIEELGWDNVTIAGGLTSTALYGAIAQSAGPAIKRINVAMQMKSFSYCSTDPVGTSDYAKFLQRLKAQNPPNFERLPYSLIAWMYDGIYMAKAAIEGSGSTEGKKIAAWINANTKGTPGVTGLMKVTPGTTFLGSAATYTMVEDIGTPRSDGLLKRAGC